MELLAGLWLCLHRAAAGGRPSKAPCQPASSGRERAIFARRRREQRADTRRGDSTRQPMLTLSLHLYLLRVPYAYVDSAQPLV